MGHLKAKTPRGTMVFTQDLRSFSLTPASTEAPQETRVSLAEGNPSSKVGETWPQEGELIETGNALVPAASKHEVRTRA